MMRTTWKDFTQVGIHSKQDICMLREVHFQYPFITAQGHGGAEAYPSMHWAKVRGLICIGLIDCMHHCIFVQTESC